MRLTEVGRTRVPCPIRRLMLLEGHSRIISMRCGAASETRMTRAMAVVNGRDRQGAVLLLVIPLRAAVVVCRWPLFLSVSVVIR